MIRLVARLAAASLLATALLFTGTTAPPVAGQTETTVDTRPVVEDPNSPVGNILPRPNTGRAPDSPNDPGGWQQYLVFGLILGGLALIGSLVVRESRRARAARST